MLNSRILATLIEAQGAIELANQLSGRLFLFQSGTVTNNDDPESRRRIKVSTETKGGLIETDWLQRLTLIPGFDPPMPLVGSTVAIAFFDGNPHDGFYIGSLQNLANPQDDGQTSPIVDHTYAIPGNHVQSTGGDSKESVKGTEDHRVEGNLTIGCGATITIKNDAGASITLMPDGSIVILDAYGKKLIWGGSSGTQYLMDFAGASVSIVNAANYSINGQQVATIGAIDDNGNTITNRGW